MLYGTFAIRHAWGISNGIFCFQLVLLSGLYYIWVIDKSSFSIFFCVFNKREAAFYMTASDYVYLHSDYPPNPPE